MGLMVTTIVMALLTVAAVKVYDGTQQRARYNKADQMTNELSQQAQRMMVSDTHFEGMTAAQALQQVVEGDTMTGGGQLGWGTNSSLNLNPAYLTFDENSGRFALTEEFDGSQKDIFLP